MVESQSDASGRRPGDRSAAQLGLLAHPFMRTTFATEESVYGVILVSGMIVVAGGHGESSWSVFLTVLVTVIVFWAAHVYAGTVARVEYLRQMQAIQHRQALHAGLLSATYRGMESTAILSGITDGRLHGNSRLGWHETQHGLTGA